MATGLQIIAQVLTIIVCAFIFIISLKSHLSLQKSNIATAKEVIRRSNKNTLGGRLYFYLLMAATGIGMLWGWVAPTYVFLMAAVVTERLIIYRICRGTKDRLGRWLVKINW
jgi:sulfite exporter TauE/SafE